MKERRQVTFAGDIHSPKNASNIHYSHQRRLSPISSEDPGDHSIHSDLGPRRLASCSRLAESGAGSGRRI